MKIDYKSGIDYSQIDEFYLYIRFSDDYASIVTLKVMISNHYNSGPMPHSTSASGASAGLTLADVSFSLNEDSSIVVELNGLSIKDKLLSVENGEYSSSSQYAPFNSSYSSSSGITGLLGDTDSAFVKIRVWK